MNADSDDWSAILNGHPIFDLPRSVSARIDDYDTSLELSSNTLPKFSQLDPSQDEPTPAGRRQVMVLKDADLIVAAGKEVRMTSLGDSKLGRSARRTYKVRCDRLLLPICSNTRKVDAAYTQYSI